MITRLLIGLTAVVLAFAVQPAFGGAGIAGVRPVEAALPPWQTDMYGTQMVPPVQTGAWGFVRFFFNEAKTEADYTVDVKGLSGTLIAGADIHRATRGSNGPVIHHLADGGFIVTSGHMQFSAADLNDIAAGNWYVSLKTYEFPDGELRGQVSLPAGFWTPTSAAPPLTQLLPDPYAGLGYLTQLLPDPSSSLGVFTQVQQYSVAGQVMPQPSAACYGDFSSVTFLWAPLPNTLVQWLDLSYYDDGFSPGTFWGYGPLYNFDRKLIWDAIPARIPFYWRINTLTPQGWVSSATGTYNPC